MGGAAVVWLAVLLKQLLRSLFCMVKVEGWGSWLEQCAAYGCCAPLADVLCVCTGSRVHASWCMVLMTHWGFWVDFVYMYAHCGILPYHNCTSTWVAVRDTVSQYSLSH
jgi:hypothetical protein